MDRRSTLQRSAATVLLLALGVTTGLVSWKPRQPFEPPGGGLRECPETWKADTLNRFIPQAFGRLNIPEFHDCQRFVVVDLQKKLAFDSLYAIFAPDNSVEAGRALSGHRERPMGYLFAIVYTYGSSNSLANGDPNTGGTYKPLGIGSGFNCLYLFQSEAPAGATLLGRMVQNGRDSICANPIDPTHPGPGPFKDLKVHPIPPATGLTSADIPSVARWDWNPRDSTQYIGVNCGSAWCEVGGRGSPSYSYATAGLPPGQRRIAEIKGWYDAQMLDTGPANHPIPIGWGTIYPVKDLWSKVESDFQGKWVPVAYVTVSKDYNWALTFKHTAGEGPPFQGTGTDGVKSNIVEYCNGNAVTTPTGVGCYFDPTTTAVPTFSACPGPPVSTPPWWRRTRDPVTGKVIHTRCLKRWDHTAMSGTPIEIPGTTRWRFAVGDMMSWGRCGGGCCQ